MVAGQRPTLNELMGRWIRFCLFYPRLYCSSIFTTSCPIVVDNCFVLTLQQIQLTINATTRLVIVPTITTQNKLLRRTNLFLCLSISLPIKNK